MFRGIYIGQDGIYQQLGEITSVDQIITTLEGLLPELRKKQQEIYLSRLSEEDLLAALSQKQIARETNRVESLAETHDVHVINNTPE